MALFFLFHYLILLLISRFTVSHYRQRKTQTPKPESNAWVPYKNRKKPQWVVDKVLYLMAISNLSYGKVGQLFNQLHGDQDTVSKTFVYNKVKQYQYEMLLIKREIKRKPPRSVPVNQTWGLDLTTVSLNTEQKLILGIVDHGSRLNLRLAELQSKHSTRIMLELCSTIKLFGFPTFIRTDNEHCFNSRWFKLCLTLLGIGHQKTQVAAPWQNGRIERFFGTFKPKIKQLLKIKPEVLEASMQQQLDIFRTWYNVIRTHDNLKGLTPAEVYANKLNRHKKAVWVSAWEGLLTGVYFPD